MKAKLINEKLPFEMVEFDFNPETLKYNRDRPGRPTAPAHRRPASARRRRSC